MFLLRGLLALVAGFTVVPFAFSAPPSAVDELKAVVVLFRHGDRSPLSSWPNDIYYGNSTLWPDGYGQLNNLGKERHYRLGQWFRERYDGFLPKRYNHNDIYIQSTDVDRTLMSAASNLAGLYPPLDDQVWNSAVNWQAIPIHTTPEELDVILATEFPCPKHDRLLEELYNSTQFQNWNEELASVFEELSPLTGYEDLSVHSFSGLFSTITIYRGFNWTLPEWTDTYWPLIKFWATRKFQWPTYTPDLARLRSGPFFDYLLSYFKSVKGNVSLPPRHVKGPRHQDLLLPNSNAPKFLMLSAHDTTLSDRTNALGVYPDAVPEFSSTVIWEVRNGTQGFYVNMFFKNSTGFSNLTLPGCEFNCLIDDYVKLVEPICIGVDQWKEECNN
ncbi:hypothetical protein ABEB36_006893 [Hypothenemus hampei]|uniref:acid phosphatase n=1 Tax=Hypothenemus hampei TaxID=57062 RepID=A0ABD1ESW3_HYPHA